MDLHSLTITRLLQLNKCKTLIGTNGRRYIDFDLYEYFTIRKQIINRLNLFGRRKRNVSANR